MNHCFDSGRDGFRRIVDDQRAAAGLQSPSGHFDEVLDPLGGRGDLTGERVPVSSARVLLRVHDRDRQMTGRRHRGRDSRGFGRHDQIRSLFGEAFGDLAADLVDDDRIDPVIEKVVDEDQVAGNPAAFRDDRGNVHGRRVHLARRARPAGGMFVLASYRVPLRIATGRRVRLG